MNKILKGILLIVFNVVFTSVIPSIIYFVLDLLKISFIYRDEIVQLFTCGLLLIINHKLFKNLKNIFSFNHFFTSLILLFPIILISISNFMIIDFSLVTIDNLMFALISGISAGIIEETVFRYSPVVCLLENNDNLGHIRKGVLIISVFFGLIHLANIFYGASLISAIYQAIMAIGAGMIFASAFVRTGSLLSSIVIHALVDVFGLLVPSLINTNGAMTSANIYSVIISIMYSTIMISLSMFYLRDKKREDIINIWKNKWR